MKIFDYPQGTEQWMRARAGRPTASQASRIITSTGEDSSQWEEYALDLIADSFRPDQMEGAFTGNHHTDRGNELEPEARDEFSRIMGLSVRQVGMVTDNDETAACSPDGLIYDGDVCIAGLELKCPAARKHTRNLINYERLGSLPPDHLAQIHWSMAVSGLDFWYFMSYCPGMRPLIIRAERNEFTRKALDAKDRFLIYYAHKRAEYIPILKIRQPNK